MNPLNNTAAVNPTSRQEPDTKIEPISGPVVHINRAGRISLASQIPTHQVSLGPPRSLSSYAVTPVAVERTETKASRFSSSSSSSPLTRTISSASTSLSLSVNTNQGTPINPVELENLLTRSLMGDEESAAVYRALEGRMSEVVKAATTTDPTQAALTEQALRLLSNLAVNSNVRAAALWATMGAAGRTDDVVAAATNLTQPAVAEQALNLLGHLTANSDVRAAELWATLGAAERAAVVTAATSLGQPGVAEEALCLLACLTANSYIRTPELWATLGARGRSAVVAAATNPAQTAVAEQALGLLSNLAANNSYGIAADLCATLGTAGHEGLIIAATTAGEPEVARSAIELLSTWQRNPCIKIAIWPLLQTRLAQLWAVSQRPTVALTANRFLLEQIRGDAHRTRQALIALNAAIPAISMRHTIATFRQWGERVNYHEPYQLALLIGIVQANTSPQKMAVFIAAVMSGIGIWRRPQGWIEALRDELLSTPMAEGIDPTPYRQHIHLVFDAAFYDKSAVLGSPVLSASKKLQLLEIIYILNPYFYPQEVQEELSKVRLMPNTSRDFKLQVIGLILNHGKASSTQFKEILAWLKGEFKKDPHTVFTNPDTLGDITDEAIYALTEQRQQYLSLYKDFGPRMTENFIRTEIAEIRQQVTTKEMPEDFGKTLIFQLRQFLPPTVIGTAVKDDGRYDSKSESK